MTLEEVLDYYGTGYKFSKLTGMSPSNFVLWKARGFIPIVSQIRIENASGGMLVARITDARSD